MIDEQEMGQPEFIRCPGRLPLIPNKNFQLAHLESKIIFFGFLTADFADCTERVDGEGKVIIDFVTDIGSLVEPGLLISTVRTKKGYETTTKSLLN